MMRVFSFMISSFSCSCAIYFQGGNVGHFLRLLTGSPERMREGAILPAILGTLYLKVGRSVISIPIGISTEIYLSEYASNPRVLKIIGSGSQSRRVASVVFGLFGLGSRRVFQPRGLEPRRIAYARYPQPPASYTLTEEALLTVPKTYSRGSLRWARPGGRRLQDRHSDRASGHTHRRDARARNLSRRRDAPHHVSAAASIRRRCPTRCSARVMALPYQYS